MTALADKLRELEAIVGADHFLTATEAVSNYRIEGQQPLALVSPGSQEELASVLKTASDSHFTVLAQGSRRHFYLGASPQPIGILLSTTRLNRVIEHDEENLTITVEAGVTLAEVQKLVAQRGQMLPLDPPGTDQATLGGIAATNLSGPLRMRYGAPRDLILGLRVALSDGSRIKTGGKTVKNVAGYELGKLFVGSYGSLGVITELTFRLTPAPEARAILASVVTLERARELAAQVLSSRLEVATLDICNYEIVRKMKSSLPITPTPQMWVLFVGLLGDREAIARQARDLCALFGAGCGRIAEEEVSAVFSALREAPYPNKTDSIVARINVPPTTAFELAALAAQLNKCWIWQRAGEGIVYLGLSEEMTDSQAEAMLSSLRKFAEDAGGYLMLESGPSNIKRNFKIWGRVPNADLMQRVKESFDPSGTLGCGRFVVGV